MGSHHLGGKDKAKVTVVPSLGSHIQTRRWRSKHTVKEKKGKTWHQRKKTKRSLKIKDRVNPSGSLDLEGSLPQNSFDFLYCPPSCYKRTKLVEIRRRYYHFAEFTIVLLLWSSTLVNQNRVWLFVNNFTWSIYKSVDVPFLPTELARRCFTSG